MFSDLTTGWCTVCVTPTPVYNLAPLYFIYKQPCLFLGLPTLAILPIHQHYHYAALDLLAASPPVLTIIFESHVFGLSTPAATNQKLTSGVLLVF